ncbi:RNA polymerase sigma factor [Chloroflexota bacterium]
MGEEDLISRAQAGEIEAFNSLVEQYEGLVYNIAFRMMGNEAVAEDATQDTFLSAYKSMGSFRGGNFQSWLLRIAANCCHDLLRSARRSRTTSLDALLENPGAPPLTDHSESPEDYALHHELGRLLSKGLTNIPAEQRLAIILYDIQGLSYEEISQVTGSSLGTVRSRLSRGRAHLRNFLRQHKELLPFEFRLK